MIDLLGKELNFSTAPACLTIGLMQGHVRWLADCLAATRQHGRAWEPIVDWRPGTLVMYDSYSTLAV